MDINFNKYQILDKFSVSRETFYLLEHYKELVLKKNEQILCWVMTNPKNYKWKAIHVKETWGRKCNVFLFIGFESGEFCGDLLV